ncbi:GAF domain-containing protein [Bradyrhizobium iriomotense]|uniref:GAF domain-containing protein n=1 Tax=Bradyrhizobium iriomotense TaxID=441950 RepID=UPI001B8A1413|nr:GAF domain-containing protein [Bradyrhizobium iriomotense]MBR1127813.1 GAF domain-containing protein [Bradyrhizobium iriomotense]
MPALSQDVVADLKQENARLLAELRAAHDRENATADVLKVIATSSSDVQPVFDAIATSANRLIGGFSTAVFRFVDGIAHLAAFTRTNAVADAHLTQMFPRPIADFPSFQLASFGKVVPVPDTEATSELQIRDVARLRGFRAMLFAPIMKGGTAIGMISVTRPQPGNFAEHDKQLLRIFAEQAVIAIDNAKLFSEVQQRTNDLTESLQQQTAVGDVLKTISRSTFDLQPVLDTLVQTAARLCNAEMAFIMRREGDLYRAGAAVGYSAEYIEFIKDHPIAPGRGTITGRAVMEKRPVQIFDVASDPEYTLQEATSLGGQHTALCVPLLRQNEPIGTIVLARQRTELFTEKQIELVTTFADQAVIAIENVRLFDELRQRTNDLSESLQQQTATADVLKVISRSAFDLQKVLDTLTESAARLCNADMAAIARKDERGFYHATGYNFRVNWVKVADVHRLQPGRDSLIGRVLLEQRSVQILDVLADPEYAYLDMQKAAGYRTLLGVPMMREGEPIGVLFLGHTTVQSFSEKQVELVSTFADQAVIAIENVRLFEEVQTTSRDLQDALTYQTGSASILKVIASSPTEIDPVLNAIVESACELCESSDAVLRLRRDDHLQLVAHHGPIVPSRATWPINRKWTAGRSILDRSPVQVGDITSPEGDEFPDGRELRRDDGVRTILSVPLLREGEGIGAITLRRTEVNPFNAKQIALLQTFADQAVIAIGNVRLFEEVRERTRELTESLEQQTATAEVLATISSSAGELEPVFDKMLENATRVCGARFGTMNLYEEGGFRTVALYNAPQAYVDTRLYQRIRPHPGSGLGTVEKTHQPVHIEDIRTQPPYIEGNPNVRALADLAGARTLVIVPMLREDELIGTITIFRQEVKPFTSKQIALVANFANQAVIAIENARLLNELRKRTKELSQSLEELRATQDRLIQTEKLASLGQLTAGIAHEIKNPLNFVNNFSSLSSELIGELNERLRATELDEAVRQEIDELTQVLQGNLARIVQHGARADSIVKNMLLHSRQGSGERRAADINGIVEEGLNLAYHGARAEKPDFHITLERKLDPSAGIVGVYPQEITRVFLNLISNGFYAAMKRKEVAGDGFEPVLSATTRGLDRAVEIRIRDNGTGIPAEVREKIFSPFFTTKPVGEGTGLGLSICHDIIVKQHGGSIDFETEPGAFTEFIITLPRTAASAMQTGDKG